MHRQQSSTDTPKCVQRLSCPHQPQQNPGSPAFLGIHCKALLYLSSCESHVHPHKTTNTHVRHSLSRPRLARKLAKSPQRMPAPLPRTAVHDTLENLTTLPVYSHLQSLHTIVNIYLLIYFLRSYGRQIIQNWTLVKINYLKIIFIIFTAYDSLPY